MKTGFSIALVLALLMLAGCTFNPSGEYFMELDSNGTPPYIEVELNFDTDTLYIWNNEWINFRYTKNGDQVNWARFIIDGQETSPNDEDHGAVELTWYFPGFEPGTHTLGLQLFTRSGTGSIADFTGAEGYLMQKDWVLIITDQYGVSCAITDTTFENGVLKIQWKEYKGLNFENYQVYKYVQPTSLPNQLVATITDQHQTSVNDANYHGENSQYFVMVNDSYRGKSMELEGSVPQLTATNNAQGDIVLHWKKPPYWGALKGYRILDDDLSWTDAGFIPLYRIENVLADSFIIPEPWFAHEYNFWLQMEPKGTPYYEDWIRPVSLATQAKASNGAESPKYSWGTTGTGTQIYMQCSNGLIFTTPKPAKPVFLITFPNFSGVMCQRITIFWLERAAVIQGFFCTI